MNEETEEKLAEREEKKPLLVRLWQEWRATILLCVGIVVVFKLILIVCTIPSGSMLPTLEVGEMVIGDRISPRLGNVDRGDIVIFPHGEVQFIKRVVGLPGEEVTVTGGSVYIDGEPLDESEYLSADVWTEAPPYLGDPAVYPVPEGCVMVMGDNRENSYDARFWPEEERYVPIKQITAVSRFHCYNGFSRLMLKVNQLIHPVP